MLRSDKIAPTKKRFRGMVNILIQKGGIEW
jgi:hypothetical protein